MLVAGERGTALRELRWIILEPLLFVGLALLLASWREGRFVGDYRRMLLRAWLIGGAIAFVACVACVGALGTAGVFDAISSAY